MANRKRNDFKLSTLPWISDAAEKFSRWLTTEAPGESWTREHMQSAGIYRSTVDFIIYEGLFTDYWEQRWFEQGMVAFGLLALEHEKIVSFALSDGPKIDVYISPHQVYSLDDFLAGESLIFRHDADYSDLSWSRVETIGHILSEYYPERSDNVRVPSKNSNE